MKNFDNIIDDGIITGPNDKPTSLWDYSGGDSVGSDSSADADKSTGNSIFDAYDAWQAAEKAKKEKADKEFEAWYLYEES
ncbi:MAG: hypothetical protein MJ137_02250, partial [Clostridia bacterium]|nr:hypothetical protein [Clostridia bacterium]